MKKRYWIILTVVVVVILARLTLSYWVTRYVNNTLQNIEGYTGSVEDIDLHLYRGAYQIDSLVIKKVEDDEPLPFVDIGMIDISVEWNALFKGSIVGEIEFHNPKINFVAAEGGKEGQSGDDVPWTKTIKELIPIQINRMAIYNGEISFTDEEVKPPVHLKIENLDMTALNLNNANQYDTPLPSSVALTANAFGDGHLSMNMDLNVLKEIPDLDLNLEFEDVSLVKLNDFLRAYSGLDAEKGKFSLYSEMAINDGALDGYVKPILEDLKILSWKNEDESVPEVIWEALAGTVTEVFENQKRDQFATQVSLQGDLNEMETGVLPAVWNIFRNAFIQAFSKQTNNQIQFGTGENRNAGQEDKKK